MAAMNPSRSRFVLWIGGVVAVAAVAVWAVTAVAGASGAGRRVLSADEVADALAADRDAAPAPGAAAPGVGAPEGGAPAGSAPDVGQGGPDPVPAKIRDGEPKLFHTSAGDIVVACKDGELDLRVLKISPKPGNGMAYARVRSEAMSKTLSALTIYINGDEQDLKIDISCVDGEPTLKEAPYDFPMDKDEVPTGAGRG
jgi:hypothetical protein